MMWQSLTEAQALIISGLLTGVLTIVAAAVGVFFGSKLFGGRVSDLKGAFDESQTLIKSHEDSIEAKLAGLVSSMKDVEAQIATAVEGIGKVRGSLGDIQSVDSDDTQTSPSQINLQEQIRSDWTAIRDNIEKIVADPSIDGRTRAKYARKDRRQYNELIESYHGDYGLPRVNSYRNAISLWHKYRNGRVSPTQGDADAMRKIRDEIGA